MPSMADYLRHVLPPESEKGWYVACVKTPKGMRQSFVQRLDDLARLLTSASPAADVYYACAQFGSNTSRKQINVCALSAFWLDVDTRVTHAGAPYENVNAAWQAVQRFVEQARLPPPLYVGSGGGLYVLWPLGIHIDPNVWRAHAAGLRAHCDRLGLHADSVRTADMASILRPVGAINHKNGVTVECGPLVGPYGIEAFSHLVEGSDDRPAKTTTKRSVSALLTGYSGSPPSYASSVVQHCKQLAGVESAHGNVVEPYWHAAAGLCTFCQDGAEWFHAASNGYEGYTFEETQGRLDRCREKLTGPTTCKRFEEVNPEGCEGCAHKGRITSPIQLGRIETEKQTDTTPAWSKGLLNGAVIPDPWQISDAGELFQFEQKGEGRTVISRYPIYLSGIFKGELDKSTSYVFKQWYPHEGWNEISVAAGDTASPQGLVKMFNQGGNIHEPALFTKFVRRSVDELHARSAPMTRYENFGWKSDNSAFLIGDRLYDGSENVGYMTVQGLSQELAKRTIELTPKGSFAEWRTAINQLFVRDAEPQTIGLLAGFAAPFMRFHSLTEGGCVLAQYSPLTNGGKSTSMEGALSIWGSPRALKIDKRDTSSSRGITMGLAGNLPLGFDELPARDPQWVYDYVTMLTNGTDKKRAENSGAAIRHNLAEWQTILITTSNTSLVDALSHVQPHDALSYRVIELLCELPEGKRATQEGDKMRRVLAENYGHAGHHFMKHVCRPDVLPAVKEKLAWWHRTIREDTRWPDDYRYWLRFLSSLAMAMEIVNQLRIFDFTPSYLLRWLLDTLKKQEVDRIEIRRRNVVLPECVNILASFFNEVIQCTMVVEKSPIGLENVQVHRPPIQRLLVRRELESGRIMIDQAALSTWLVKRGVSVRTMLGNLRRAEILLDASTWANLGKGTPYGMGQSYVCVVDGFHPALTGVVRKVEEKINETGRRVPL